MTPKAIFLIIACLFLVSLPPLLYMFYVEPYLNETSDIKQNPAKLRLWKYSSTQGLSEALNDLKPKGKSGLGGLGVSHHGAVVKIEYGKKYSRKDEGVVGLPMYNGWICTTTQIWRASR